MPIYAACKSFGLETVAIGSFPSDPAVAYADHYISADYSDPSSLGVLAGQVDFVVPTCNDMSYLACVKVANDLGLKEHDANETAQVISHKGRFRQWGSQHSIQMPESFNVEPTAPSVNAFSQSLQPGKSYLVKPTDSHTGLGITRITEGRSLPEAVLHARVSSKSASFLIEEEVPGQLLSTSLFLSSGRTIAHFVVDEFCVRYPYAVDHSNHPSTLPPSARELARALALQIARVLGLRDGLLHTQMITDGDQVWAIESMRRCPGDFFGTLVELSTGFPYYRHYIAPFIGREVPIEQLDDPDRGHLVCRQTVTTSAPGTFARIGFGATEGAIEFYPLARSGARTAPLPYGKIGVAFTRPRVHSNTSLDARMDARAPSKDADVWEISCYE